VARRSLLSHPRRDQRVRGLSGLATDTAELYPFPDSGALTTGFLAGESSRLLDGPQKPRRRR
jgi:hypothetical protein